MAEEVILKIANLSVQYGQFWAVKQADFVLKKGEILGIVGESGAGKSTIGRAIVNLLRKPGRITSGSIVFEDLDLTELSQEQMRKIRGGRISFIPQDPLSSLNPAFRIRPQVTDILKIHLSLKRGKRKDLAISFLQKVAIGNPRSFLDKYPHELSGGMRQRVMIAIAFSCEPSLIIADEPTTSLDVTTQVQILQTLLKMKRETKTSVIYITHNLGVVAKICDRVIIMYDGRIVETAPTKMLFERPLHPYTKALIRAVPRHDVESDRLEGIEEVEDLSETEKKGCGFALYCSDKIEVCRMSPPPSKKVSKEHEVTCHLFEIG